MCRAHHATTTAPVEPQACDPHIPLEVQEHITLKRQCTHKGRELGVLRELVAAQHKAQGTGSIGPTGVRSQVERHINHDHPQSLSPH